MCGIAGEFRFDGQKPQPQTVARMLQQLQRRGPDGGGQWQQGQIALGHRRLAIIDLSDAAAQPMVDSETGLTLVFNGTIYNYPELRQQLIAKGHTFRSHGDSEVILKAYAEWGEAAVARLDGMFAFAIWDSRQQRLFLARDRIGIKPLYYSHTPQRFLFASNTQALLATGGIDTTLNPIALHHHFTLHAVVPAPDTILAGIHKLPPAHTLLINYRGEAQLNRYWSLTAERPATPLSEAQWLERIKQQLQQAVKKRLKIADVPVGVLLSGGLDSSLLVALLADQGVSDLHTFSIGFEDQPEERGSEFEYSDQVVERYQSQHHKIIIANEQVLQRLPEAVTQMAEPMVGQDAVAFYLLAEQVSQTVKVVQSGQGADELFGGYFWYSQMVAAEGSPLERFAPFYFDRDHADMVQMLQPEWISGDVTAATIEALLQQPGADSWLDQILRLDVTTLIVDDPVKRVDNMTMAWGLEARVPFLDHHLIEQVMQAPPALKLGPKGDEAKYALKEIARPLLPAAVIDRQKGYFPMPALKYVRGEFLDFMGDILNSQACRQRGLYQRRYVDKLLLEPDQHFTRLQGSQLWHLALPELWLQQQGL
ncbi:N-acetylglutaminylglutamine amidotransferase [Ectothiorhodospiraceae bacterium BW-2]|nr:N-acetylglutaminylglutamine amidotransferase [Ectothiorhodospiraceae bacterium BW-2]